VAFSFGVMDVKDFGLRSSFIQKNKQINILIEQGEKECGIPKHHFQPEQLQKGT